MTRAVTDRFVITLNGSHRVPPERNRSSMTDCSGGMARVEIAIERLEGGDRSTFDGGVGVSGVVA
jgi:hypothetical protein